MAERGEQAVTARLLRGWPLPAAPVGGKEARGRVVIVGGSRSTPGAALLAASAALRAGAGKLQIATVQSTAVHLAVAVPESLVQGLPETADGAIDPKAAEQIAGLAAGAQAVLVGPGLSDPDASRDLVRALLPHLGDAILVLDALALAAVTDDPHCLESAGAPVVLTPNIKEMARLLDCDQDEVREDAGKCARTVAADTGAVVSLGGEESWIAAPDGRCWSDATGGVGLGVSGSGDVNAGVLAGLTARGAEPEQAAVWAAHIHGRAGDRLAARVGRLGYLATELLPQIPQVIMELEA